MNDLHAKYKRHVSASRRLSEQAGDLLRGGGDRAEAKTIVRQAGAELKLALVLWGELQKPAGSSPRVARIRKRQGRAYELAYRGQQQAPDWLIVHGEVNDQHGSILTPMGLRDPRMGHAWLEKNGCVYDPVQDRFFVWRDYVREWGAVVRARFTPSDTTKYVLQTGVYGPWEHQEPLVADASDIALPDDADDEEGDNDGGERQ